MRSSVIRLVMVLVMLAALGWSSPASAETAQVSVTLLPGPFEVGFEVITEVVDDQPQSYMALVVTDFRGPPPGDGWQVQVDCTCAVIPAQQPIEMTGGLQSIDEGFGPSFDVASNIFEAEPGYGAGQYRVLFEMQPNAVWSASILGVSIAS